jgi:hypothetical protein
MFQACTSLAAAASAALLLAVVLPPSSAWAVGLGRIRGATVLGQPLDMQVTVRLEDGEPFGPECVAADVMSGEQHVPPAAVRLFIDPGADATERTLRVTTSVAIDEPVITVTLSAGCGAKVSRRIVAFADPPIVRTPVVMVTAVAEPEPATATLTAAQVPSVLPAPRDAAPLALAGTAIVPGGLALLPATQSLDALPPTGASSPAAAPAAAAAPEPRPQPRPQPRREAASEAAASAVAPRRRIAASETAASAPPQPVVAAARPRLQLEPSELMLTQASAASADSRASEAQQAASAAQAAALAAGERLHAMEQELVRLRSESRAQNEQMLALRERLVETEAARRFQPVLVLLLALLAAAAAWLLWRLRKLSRGREAWWDGEAAPASVPPVSLPAPAPVATTAAPNLPPLPPLPPLPLAAEAPVSIFEVSHPSRRDFAHSTRPVPHLTSVVSMSMPLTDTTVPAQGRRELTVDEQIDLDQQADFFIALGQDDAAIDLLLGHLRSTGGTSPMPYLKLLAVHRRRDEREAYERARTRFNQRFNGVAPDWETDPSSGRSLDDYPNVMARIQHAWWSPLDAMAELEALLFRRGDRAELFELPAYRDLLTLYQLARELQLNERGEGRPDVDVHLPLDGSFVPQGPAPARPANLEPLDLDLSAEVPMRRVAGGSAFIDLDAAPSRH